MHHQVKNMTYFKKNFVLHFLAKVFKLSATPFNGQSRCWKSW